MEIIFKSILREEMASFLNVIRLSIADVGGYRFVMAELDGFLHKEGLSEKKLNASQIERWVKTLNVKPPTKQAKLSKVKRFADYLSALGIYAELPKMPRVNSDFRPYVFTYDEMRMIFEVADDLSITSPSSTIAAQIPLLLRILYGCGLRLGEAASLNWDDVDLDSGVLTIKEAKYRKQRIVPMCDELSRILKLYKKVGNSGTQGQGYLFSDKNGKPRNKGCYWNSFHGILCEIGVKNPQTAKYAGRGPCIHSLRHTFTMHSFLKAEAEGKDFLASAPFLSTYLGHESLIYTDKYLKARYELYPESHAVIEDYTRCIFPEDL